jgi:hypothetical protein
MVIPLKLETLLEGRVVEQYRVEYKRGIRTIPSIRFARSRTISII